jgi:hypothetical protein
VGPKAVLDAVVKREIPSPCWEPNHRTPIVQPVAQRYTDYAIKNKKKIQGLGEKDASNSWKLHVDRLVYIHFGHVVPEEADELFHTVSLCELINNSIDESFDVLKYTGV